MMEWQDDWNTYNKPFVPDYGTRVITPEDCLRESVEQSIHDIGFYVLVNPDDAAARACLNTPLRKWAEQHEYFVRLDPKRDIAILFPQNRLRLLHALLAHDLIPRNVLREGLQ